MRLLRTMVNKSCLLLRDLIGDTCVIPVGLVRTVRLLSLDLFDLWTLIAIKFAH